MNIERTRWHENSIAVERGPLVYALKIEDKWNKADNKDEYGPYNEVVATTGWNYGLVSIKDSELPNEYKIVQKPALATYPWTLKNAPIEIKVPAKRLVNWQLYHGEAGPLPYSVQDETHNLPTEEVTLIPYGCTTLRISEFPEVR